MNLNSMGLVKNLTVSAAIEAYRIVAFGAAVETIMQASAASDLLVGVTGVVGAVAADERVDVYMDGVRTVEFGGDFEAGDPLMADADGKAIKAVTPVDTTIRIVGFAMEAGGAGVLGQVHISPQTMRG